ncbi:hypothetical protein PUNSTDRAFT_143962 [Punctularia strigosozonata HHB-11173 SS5]|uniref:uncharacterized protein n=1 Tax=Punctularia strigosozonata (strain HHB-11173) TaxID=741275 RepID=UPI000441695B|nr:uncharacterized protein PUNSTDRAFT_143962 [Punctularia strigosozonata HHB-11173 SS5]EIN08336.1 hypothetical protein PUNSTDRAFT_143962 [Punctularia strigosozonata HHB-11173 SS5]
MFDPQYGNAHAHSVDQPVVDVAGQHDESCYAAGQCAPAQPPFAPSDAPFGGEYSFAPLCHPHEPHLLRPRVEMPLPSPAIPGFAVPPSIPGQPPDDYDTISITTHHTHHTHHTQHTDAPRSEFLSPGFPEVPGTYPSSTCVDSRLSSGHTSMNSLNGPLPPPIPASSVPMHPHQGQRMSQFSQPTAGGRQHSLDTELIDTDDYHHSGCFSFLRRWGKPRTASGIPKGKSDRPVEGSKKPKPKPKPKRQ